MTRINIRTLGGISLLLIASSTFGFLATEEESGANETLTPIYRQIAEAQDSKSVEALCSQAFALYRKGGIVVTQDQYRAAAVMSKSKHFKQLQLAHDLSLAALHDGFLPAQKVVRAVQARILEQVGVDKAPLPKHGKYVPLDRPTFSRPSEGAKGGIEATTATAEVATTAMVQIASPRH